MFWILAAITAVAFGYHFFVRRYKYWTRKGVKQGRPYPIVGDNLRTFARMQNFAEVLQSFYNKFPEERYVGMYSLLLPALVVRDPELIKQLTVKDFDYFTDHMPFMPEDADPLFMRNLPSLKGQKWRDMRSTLSPAFTSSKMKGMFSLMLESAEQFSEYFLKQGVDVIEIEMKDTFTRFTNDVIASCAFGIKCNSLEEQKNSFYLMGKEATNSTGSRFTIIFMLYILLPKFFGLKVFSARIADFFCTLVKSNIEEREKHGIVRQDMIHLMMQARKQGVLSHEESQPIKDTGFATIEESEVGKGSLSTKTQLTDIDITAQALIFFFAGFDSVSTTMCFMSHELAINPDIQQKLRKEVDETLEACGGKLTYEALLEMKYMDMVVSETLRLWPVASVTDRICTKSYTIEPTRPEEKPVNIEKGNVIWLPIFPLHRDPKYFPEPTRFDPERFSDENKDNIKPYSYLPFGTGPRACIGSRFALLEVKALYFYILRDFEIVPTEKTTIPLRLNRKTFNMAVEHGFWFGLTRRGDK